MIPNTTFYLVFIRLSIWGLRAVTPASAAYCLTEYLGYVPRLPLPLHLLAYIEVAFYLLISLPQQRAFNRSRPREITRSFQERDALFTKCWSSIADYEVFLRFWFEGADLSEIHREDLKDFLAWGFFYRTKALPEDNNELEHYVCQTEKALNRSFKPGRGTKRPIQVSTDELRLQHKPFLFYVFAIGADDFMTYAIGRWIGLQHFRLPLRRFFTVFPLRPWTLATTHVSPSEKLSYWYRPHTSKKRKPVLFIHGIGAGMRTYTSFLNDLMKSDFKDEDDGQVGIIALELMQLAMRITTGIPVRAEMLAEINKILDFHAWDKFVIVGHSYGSIIATHLLQQLGKTGRVGPLLLVDPVTLSIHWGGVPYNFLYRQPQKASEWQLHYFASTDMCVAHSITRRFDWSENVLWKEDLRDRAVTVALAEEDIIMDPVMLWKYLENDESIETRFHRADEFQHESKAGKALTSAEKEGGVDVIWYSRTNHAEMWETREKWMPLVEILCQYTKMSW